MMELKWAQAWKNKQLKAVKGLNPAAARTPQLKHGLLQFFYVLIFLCAPAASFSLTPHADIRQVHIPQN